VGFEINLRTNVPSYRQLADQLAAAIDAGEYAPGDPIPSLRQLQQETGLAQGTIQHAIRALVKEGRVIAVVGRGTFVVPRG
jgi:GntR family transcriptional regulator